MIRPDPITVQLSIEDSARTRYQLARNASQCMDIYRESLQFGFPDAVEWFKKANDLKRLSELYPDFREGKP